MVQCHVHKIMSLALNLTQMNLQLNTCVQIVVGLKMQLCKSKLSRLLFKHAQYHYCTITFTSSIRCFNFEMYVQTPVIAWETLSAGNFLYPHQTKMNWCNSFWMWMSYVCSVKATTRLEPARHFLIAVPYHIPCILTFFTWTTWNP